MIKSLFCLVEFRLWLLSNLFTSVRVCKTLGLAYNCDIQILAVHLIGLLIT